MALGRELWKSVGLLLAIACVVNVFIMMASAATYVTVEQQQQQMYQSMHQPEAEPSAQAEIQHQQSQSRTTQQRGLLPPTDPSNSPLQHLQHQQEVGQRARYQPSAGSAAAVSAAAAGSTAAAAFAASQQHSQLPQQMPQHFSIATEQQSQHAQFQQQQQFIFDQHAMYQQFQQSQQQHLPPHPAEPAQSYYPPGNDINDYNVHSPEQFPHPMLSSALPQAQQLPLLPPGLHSSSQGQFGAGGCAYPMSSNQVPWINQEHNFSSSLLPDLVGPANGNAN